MGLQMEREGVLFAFTNIRNLAFTVIFPTCVRVSRYLSSEKVYVTAFLPSVAINVVVIRPSVIWRARFVALPS